MFSHSHSVLGNGITDWIIKQDMIAAKYFCLVRQRQKRHFLRRWSRLCMKGTCLPCFLHIFHSCQRITRKMDVLPFGVWARQLYLWLCIVCVSHGNVKCNKPHKVDHNCKNAACFPAYSLFGETVLAQYLRKSLIWQIQGCKAQRCGYWRILFFFYFHCGYHSFVPTFGLGVILCMKTTDLTGCAEQRRAGRLRAGTLS